MSCTNGRRRCCDLMTTVGLPSAARPRGGRTGGGGCRWSSAALPVPAEATNTNPARPAAHRDLSCVIEGAHEGPLPVARVIIVPGIHPVPNATYMSQSTYLRVLFEPPGWPMARFQATFASTVICIVPR